MKKTSIILLTLFLFSNTNFAQINFHAKIGTGIIQFYRLGFSDIGNYSKLLPAIGSKIGLGITYNYKNDSKSLTINIMFEQKTLKYKTIVNDSMLWITNDASYYIYDDYINRANFYAISIPIIFNKSFNNKIGLGIGLSNNFILNRQKVTELQRLHTFKYQLKLALNFSYKLSNRIDLFSDIQNNISPVEVHKSAKYLLYNCFCSFGICYNLGAL